MQDTNSWEKKNAQKTPDPCSSDKGLFSVSWNIYASLLLSLSVGGGGEFLWTGTWKRLGWYGLMKDGGESFRFILLSALSREAARHRVN